MFEFIILKDPSNSSSKSADGASKNTVQSSHPFRVIDNDGLSIHSMQSLGRVGRILSGSVDPSGMSVNRESVHAQSAQHATQKSESPTSNSDSPSNTPLTSHQQRADDNNSQNSNYSLTMNHSVMLQEPDVIASTKLAHSKTTDSVSYARSYFNRILNLFLVTFRSLQLVLEQFLWRLRGASV